MEDGFEATFVVDLAIDEVWEAITSPSPHVGAEAGPMRYLIAGFPAFGADHAPGTLATELEVDPGRLLRVHKDEEPCAGTEIAIVLENAETGTRVTVVQSGFGPWLKSVRDTFEAHWLQIVHDLRLFIERGIRVPGTAWGADLGATTKQHPLGLEITAVTQGAYAERLEMQPGDLLLTLRNIRVHDIQQLWTILALSTPGDETEASWARGRDVLSASATL
ncbi:MAG: hypothetical protein E2O54_11050 [Gammaproteobacteria bacterium]|nr:MAG: hypothetical protein E2O58_03910 [Gammaproteobacteria bacterium]TDJ39195.1 MAG: hypothetical protein E2O54_11050 [Gammaproteobacteria bacterium]